MAFGEGLRIRLDDDVKERFTDECDSRGTTPADVIRPFIHEFLGDKCSSVSFKSKPVPERRWHVVNTRLTTSERKKVQDILDQEKKSVTDWLLRLIRKAILDGPQLNKDELTVVNQSMFQLRSIGRNLNQMVRALNEGKGDRGSFNEDYANRLRDHVNDLADHLQSMVKASTQRDFK